MQIVKQRSECGLVTNSMKFMQQMTSSSEGDNNVCNCYLIHTSPSAWQI